MLLENQIIFEGDRLEPFFENIPGQWGTIWLLDGSFDNEFSCCTIKNASVGIYTTGGANFDNYKLNLSSVEVYNSSVSILIQANASNVRINLPSTGASTFSAIGGGVTGTGDGVFGS